MTDQTLVLSGLDDLHTPDSVQVIAGCGHRAWISTSGVMMTLTHPGIRTVCMACVPPGTKTVAPVPGSEQELAAMFGPDEAKRMLTRGKRALETGRYPRSKPRR